MEIDGFETGNCEPGPGRRTSRIVALKPSAYRLPEPDPLTPAERNERIERYTQRAAANLPLNEQPTAGIEGQA